MATLQLASYLDELKSIGLWLEGQMDGQVDLVVSDSRKLKNLESNRRALFFARKGVSQDGHDFLKELSQHPSIEAFVLEKLPLGFSTSKPVIRVRNSTKAMAYAIKSFQGDPSREFFMGAVTGTNGKTTTTFLMQALLKTLKFRVARSGTIETEFEGHSSPSELTTPDFEQLQRLLADLKTQGANALVFEASSHALEQGRLYGIELDAAIFTNLTPEHLDYHRNMENYYQAKKRLFGELLAQSSKKKKIAVVPLDGSYGSRLCDELSSIASIDLVTWTSEVSAKEKSSYWLKNFETDLSGTEVTVVDRKSDREFRVRTSLPGHYNAENMMGVIALGLHLGASPQDLQRAFDIMPPVSGRLERVKIKSGYVFVDYAHTPDALENVLMTLRPLTKGKLKVVFGCGGDRDRSKRPKMGEIAELYADEVFVTSDNPRTEDPEGIIQEILQGMQRLKPVKVEPDRKTAIQLALKDLASSDVLLIAGKGHETYQILGSTKIPFDDRKVVLESSL